MVPNELLEADIDRWEHEVSQTGISGGFKGGKGGANEPPFGLDLVQRSTGDRLNGTPPSV